MIMTKEEFNTKEAEIKEKIRYLKEELKKIQDEYARSNSQIPEGTKVRTNRGEIGIFKGNKFELGSIRPIVLRFKKDGNVSKQEIPWYRFETIEPIE